MPAGFKIAQDQIDEIEHVFASHPGGYEIVSISESKSEGVRARKEWEEVMDTQENINVAINFAAHSIVMKPSAMQARKTMS